MGLKDASVFGNRKSAGLPETSLKYTRWSDAAAKGESWTEYPRPQMVREQWFNLNGHWDYAIVPKNTGDNPPETYDGLILVPFSPESVLSGVERQLQPDEYLWYHRCVEVPEPETGHHYLLHFGAVDQCCTVYINGRECCDHVGGYLPFTVDLKDICGSFELTVRVSDVSDTSWYSRGKQKLRRGGMYYTAQSGIWQTVWMEPVPDRYISSVFCEPDIERGSCHVTIRIEGTEEEQIEKDIYPESVHLWSPEDPYLYPLEIQEGEDRVSCYYAMRKLSIEKASDGYMRFFLNGKPILQTGVLDQGYWCDGLYTAPSDEALIHDITTMKDLGFNLIRKHIKIEPDRWYYHCDRLGMLVWQDMVNGGSTYRDWFVTYLATAMNIRHLSIHDGIFSRFLLSRRSKEGREQYIREMEETIKTLRAHPSIICWVPFNEGWGQFDAKKVTDRIREIDSTRFVDSASGWFDQKCGDVVSCHHYFFKLHFKPEKKRVLALSEFGGYTFKVPGHVFSDELYGYGGYESAEALTEAYEKLFENEVLPAMKKGMSAFVYTQLSDIENEANGLLTYDREVLKPEAEAVRKYNLMIRNYPDC